MSTKTTRYFIKFIVSLTIFTVVTPLGATDEIPKIDGYYAGGLIDGDALKKREIGLAFVPTRKSFIRSSVADFSSQKLLEKIAKDASDIRGKLNAAKSASQAGIFDTAEKGKAKDGLCIVFFPKKEITVSIGGQETALKPYSPGVFSNLKDIESAFGSPTEKERFEGQLWVKLGFDGLVCWWQDVGVAVTKDGALTHVLVRAAP